MGPDVREGLRNNSCSRHVLKKGPWTAAEDLLLMEYVKKNGEGNWNAVQRNSGLMRCGKSCRLRWANHLRPHLKKGAFSPDEERLIVDLHAKLGNKWARMAAQMPGRTDNEIKNYWNTRLKRRQRAGLPIYPHEVAEKERLLNPSPKPSLSSLHHQHHRNNNHSPFTFPQSIINPNNSDTTRANPLYTHSQLKLYQDNNGGLSLSLDAANSVYSSSTFFSTAAVNQLPISSTMHYGNNPFNPLGYGGMGALGLPSIQSAAAVTPAGSSSDFVVSSDGGEDFEVDRRSRSGLLEDLFGESQALAYGGKREEDFVAGGGNLKEEGADFGFSHGVSSSHASYEGAETKAIREGMAPMDDELMNLLDNFPLSVPIPDWNGGDGSESPILTNGTSSATQSQPITPEYNPIEASNEAPNQEWNFGSCLWNNMPSIY